jgi:hypothetical protein
MANAPVEQCNPNPNGILSLVSGILRDASTLITKELTAAKLELREELADAKSTAVVMGIGLAALLVGGILLALMLVYLIQEFAGLELWACYGIVGGLMTLVAVAALLFGKRRAAKTNLMPTATIENAKEDARWITRRVKYETK